MLKTLFLLFVFLHGFEAFVLTMERNVAFPCPDKDGFYGAEDDCFKVYYACVAKVPYTQNCPGSLVWDSTLGRCVNIDICNVNVGATPEPSPSSTSNITPSIATTYSPIIPTLPSSSTIRLPDGPTSHSTISTITDETSDLQTSDVEITVAETSETESTSSNETEANNATSKPSTITTTPEIEEFICPADGYHAKPGTCGSDYYICISGVAYPETCPNETIFDDKTKLCTHLESASCYVFECPSPDGRFPTPGKCSGKYWICIGGEPYPQNCPGSAIFDPVLAMCTAPENASCM